MMISQVNHLWGSCGDFSQRNLAATMLSVGVVAVAVRKELGMSSVGPGASIQLGSTPFFNLFVFELSSYRIHWVSHLAIVV